jgi:hypothetical protein
MDSEAELIEREQARAPEGWKVSAVFAGTNAELAEMFRRIVDELPGTQEKRAEIERRLQSEGL